MIKADIKQSFIVDLKNNADPKKAVILQRYFKTGKGEYGEGDIFVGLTVPVLRSIAKKYQDINFSELQFFISSKLHEYRLVALLVLVAKYESAVKIGNEADAKKVVNFYIKNLKHINNWDLVDLSAPKILGYYYFQKDKADLYKLSDSMNLWHRRIAILSTFYFIKNGKFTDSLKLAKKYLQDSHDLIHKSTGWMLREIGKKNSQIEIAFLRKYHKQMPRIMFRYAIERLNSKQRAEILK
jgi:3-methyladenine DNA glycosylase AlkD